MTDWTERMSKVRTQRLGVVAEGAEEGKARFALAEESLGRGFPSFGIESSLGRLLSAHLHLSDLVYLLHQLDGISLQSRL